jgi:methylenetetrahydrofolate dehydrogenase (NADP+)/methenyltetrahydrofolate cyclohydrolase
MTLRNKPMTQIVDGHKIASRILQAVTQKVAILRQQKIYPKLGIVLVGDDAPSLTYVNKKENACRQVGVDFILKKFEATISEDELIDKIRDLQADLSGLIIQLPLPNKFNKYRIVNIIQPELDVDFLTDVSLGKLVSGNYAIDPPTPGAILEILREYKIDLAKKVVLLVGAGDLIGRPLANILMQSESTVIVANKQTRDLEKLGLQADIIISAVGQPKLITAKMIKTGAVVIDAGILIKEKRVYGDVDFDSVAPLASLITSTPGGVGPITVAKLIKNVVDLAEIEAKFIR